MTPPEFGVFANIRGTDVELLKLEVKGVVNGTDAGREISLICDVDAEHKSGDIARFNKKLLEKRGEVQEPLKLVIKSEKFGDVIFNKRIVEDEIELEITPGYDAKVSFRGWA